MCCSFLSQYVMLAVSDALTRALVVYFLVKVTTLFFRGARWFREKSVFKMHIIISVQLFGFCKGEVGWAKPRSHL